MTKKIFDWLPRSTFVDPRIKAIFAEEASSWSRRWFGDRADFTIIKFGVVRPDDGVIPAEGKWNEIGGGVACHWNDKQGILIAKLIVDADDRRHPHNMKDSHLLCAVANEALCDFGTAIAKATDMPRALVADIGMLQRDGGLLFSLGTTKKSLPQLHFGIPFDIASRIRKAMINSIIDPKRIEGRLADAFGPEELTVAVRLGEARVPAHTLWDIAPGDVILLDTTINGVFPMVSAKSEEPICNLQLSLKDDDITLLVADK